MHHSTGARRFAGVALLLSLCACSGGSGDGEISRQVNLSTHSLSFSAPAPGAAAPAAQVITATFSEGVTNLSVVHSGQGIASVTTTVGSTSAQITVTPAAPTTLGAGAFNGSLAVTPYFCADAGCTRLDAGESQTVRVAYQISPAVELVAPNVATAGVSAVAIIRGAGFSGYAIQGVRFGTVAATSVTVTSDTEIRAVYPALTAGSYAVSLDIPTHQGTVPSTATLIAVDAVTRTAEALPWPGAITGVKSLRHDAQRDALLIATDTGTIVRYGYAGGAWEAATTTALPTVQGLALTTDGTQLLAITNTQLVPLDPVTLAAGTAVTAPTLTENAFLKSISVTNDNIALVTTGIAESKATDLYTYAIRTATMTKLTAQLNNATTGAAGNGSIATLVQGDPSLTTAPAVYNYTALSGNFSTTGVTLIQNAIAPVIDRDASRIVLNGVNVHGPDYGLLGKLPATTLAVAVRPDGKRAYTYDSAAGGLMTFDISATKSGEAYTQLGSTVPLVATPGDGAKMIISADGATLFLAGATQIVVQPTPVDP